MHGINFGDCSSFRKTNISYKFTFLVYCIELIIKIIKQFQDRLFPGLEKVGGVLLLDTVHNPEMEEGENYSDIIYYSNDFMNFIHLTHFIFKIYIHFETNIPISYYI